MNTTITLEGAAATCATPWYYSSAPALVPGLSDAALALLAPLVAYWGLSTLFAYLDAQDWPALARHRIHDSAEVASKNRATKAEVLRAVIFQQVIQTALGAWWMADEAAHQLVRAEHCARAAAWQAPLAKLLAPVLGAPAAHALAVDGAYFVYWWAVPVFQFAFAMCVRPSRPWLPR
jgi:sphinganine C4-monooxygenase